MYTKLNSIDEISDNAIIFKHSNTCSLSARAKDEVNKIAEKENIFIIIVQENRELSNKIEEVYKIKHESPQFIIIRNNEPQSVLNHLEITEEKIEKLLKI
ncbi:thioredoxin family protein [Candidatus Woesearchaeota archaeon]|nr:thioredoxin family protein [Candidatus Woesearchaeota archaeon]